MALINRISRFGSPATQNPFSNSYQTQLFTERAGSPSSYSSFLTNSGGTVPAPPPPGESLLLMESDGNLLLEDGNLIALEQQ